MKYVFLSFLLSLWSSFSYAQSSVPEFVPGEYIVKLKPEFKSFKNLNSLENIFNARVKSQFPQYNLITIKKASIENKDSAIQRLLSTGLVDYVEPNYIYRMNKAPADSKYKQLWGLKNSGQRDSDGTRGVSGVDINVEKAWDIHTGSKNMIVAIIDTGIDFSHPDLAENLWTNMKELNGKKGIDDDGNGIIDDIHGYNTIREDGDADDDQGHGSHCAGTIGAKGNNNLGVSGINWNVSLMAIKFLNADGSGDANDSIKGIDYAIKMGAKVLSNSWGGYGYSKALAEVIQRAQKAGVLFIAAAGNDGRNNEKEPFYPASYNIENIISVAAIDNRGRLANFSNYGLKTVDLAAPGVNITSTTGGSYDSFSGTSMATPHVAGGAALVWSREPQLTAVDVKARLLKTVRPLSSLKGKVATGGMLDVYSAMTVKK